MQAQNFTLDMDMVSLGEEEENHATTSALLKLLLLRLVGLKPGRPAFVTTAEAFVFIQESDPGFALLRASGTTSLSVFACAG